MAQAIEIHLWCDVCLESGKHISGTTITVPPILTTGAFEAEVCEAHAQPLADALAKLAALGRKPEGAAPERTRATRKGRPDDAPAPNTCPLCGSTNPSLAALRSHLRDEHDKGLSDVGLAARNLKCSECPPDSGWFARGQGFAAHRRSLHPNADPDGRAVAAKAHAA